MKTGWVIFETIQSGELTPGYQAISIYPELNETFEAMFKAVSPKEYAYKGVFDRRQDAINWVDNWRAA